MTNVISYGGGVQSTALLVLAATGRLDATVALFANVGDDSEHPDSLRYVREVAKPYAEAHGIAMVEVCKTRRDGTTPTLRQSIGRTREVPLPMFMGSKGGIINRQCTKHYKVNVINKWLKANGATAADPATVYVGISWDEAQRVDRRPMRDFERVVYPLVVDRLDRWDCKGIIESAGLPVPGKSSCFFCPFNCHTSWANLKRRQPELFAQAVQLERDVNAHLLQIGRIDRFTGEPLVGYLTPHHKPLDEVVNDDQLELFGSDAGCPSGYCFT